MTDPYAGRRQPEPDYEGGRSLPADPRRQHGYPGSEPAAQGYYQDDRRDVPDRGYHQGRRSYPPDPGYGQGYDRDDRPRPRRKKRRIFLWVFLAIQALFVIWVIAGAASKTPGTSAQIAQQCYNHHWFPLFKSQADCVTHFGGALNDAGDAGKAIGIGLIIVFWMVVDVILGISYGVYRLATRSR